MFLNLPCEDITGCSVSIFPQNGEGIVVYDGYIDPNNTGWQEWGMVHELAHVWSIHGTNRQLENDMKTQVEDGSNSAKEYGTDPDHFNVGAESFANAVTVYFYPEQNVPTRNWTDDYSAQGPDTMWTKDGHDWLEAQFGYSQPWWSG